jgi:outer membrane protein assembly factor BamA
MRTWVPLLLTVSLAAPCDIRADEAASDRQGTRWGALPISNYTTDRGLQLGALAQRFDYGPEGTSPFQSLLTLELSVATRGEKELYASFERAGLEGGRRLGFELQASRNDFQHYYGIGAEGTRDAGLEARGYNYYSYEEESMGAYERRPTPWGFDARGAAAIILGASTPTQGQETLYGKDFGGGTRRELTPRLELGAVWERRDSEFSPSRGWFGSLSASGAPGTGGSTSSWLRGDGDWRNYLPILEDRGLLLATQLRYSVATPGTPLVDKPRLGSLGTLRGLPSSRYVDDHSVSARAELRALPIRTRVFGMPLKGGLAVFGDAGRVASDWSGLFRGRAHFGAGLSLFGSYFTDDFIGSADLGFSEGTQALYLRLGHAF